MSILLLVLKAVVIIVVILFVALFFFQERLLFFPSKLPKDYTFNFKSKFEERWLKVGDSEVHNLYFEASNAPGTILYFHGNGGAMDGWGEVASDLADRTGWSIWMVDYPSYGKSLGTIKSEEELHQIALAAYAEVQKLSANKKIVLYGRSLGSGIATRLASIKDVAGLVLETPYYSVSDMAKIRFPFIPSFIVRYKMPSNEWIQNVKCPKLFVHGTADDVIPYSQGQKLYAETPGPKEFLTIEGENHSNLPSHSEYWASLKSFLARILTVSN